MSFAKGDEVVVVSGSNKGVTGTVFWIGESKFDDGMRAGVRDADGEAHWIDFDDLRKAGEEDEALVEGNHLDGLKIVLTGDFEAHTRKQASDILESLGADVTSAVSGKTKVIIVGKKPGATKLNKAKKLELPELNESQMLDMIAGQTLEQVLGEAGSSEENSKFVDFGGLKIDTSNLDSEQIDKLESMRDGGKSSSGDKKKNPEMPDTSSMPAVLFPPRDGTYETYHPGTKQLHVQGEYKNGLKSGTWKMWWPNGQLKQEYGWELGRQHGVEYDWAENGTQVCDGRNENGKREGEWTWWHDDGKRYHGYTYVAGKKTGDYVWDDKDGVPRARGGFDDDKFHGRWEWVEPEKTHQRTIREYIRGTKHGEEHCWYNEEQKAIERHNYLGSTHGLEQTWYADGSPKYHGEWAFGMKLGTHKSWDESGTLTEENFINGLPEKVYNDKKLAEKIAKKIKKAKDAYKKGDVVSDNLEYGYQAVYMAHLWREGIYDVSKDPMCWEQMTWQRGLFTGEEFLKFLSTAKTRYRNEYDEMQNAHANHLLYWPSYLDQMAMNVFEVDPEPILNGWQDLPEKMMKGMAFVIARCGGDVGDVLKGELKALVDKHVNEYSLGERVRVLKDGLVEEIRIYHDHPRFQEPNDNFDLIVGYFGGRDAWKKELTSRVPKAQKKGQFNPTSFYDVIVEADLGTLAEIFKTISDVSVIEKVLRRWRSDSAEDLFALAKMMTDKPYPRRAVVTCAILAYRDADQSVPDELALLLPLHCESTTATSEWYTSPLKDFDNSTDPALHANLIPILPGTARWKMKLYYEAINVLSTDVLRKLVEKQLTEKYGKVAAVVPLYRIPDPELWATVIEEMKEDSYGQTDRNTMALGDIGLDAIPLMEPLATKGKVKIKEAWWQGIIQAISIAIDRGEEIPESLDHWVKVNGMKDDYYYAFLQPMMERIVFRLPQDRAEKIVLEGLESKFWRGFKLVPCCPTERVVQFAMHKFLGRSTSMEYSHHPMLTAVLRSLDNAEDWVRWLLEAGLGETCESPMSNAIGWERLKELREEIEAGGVEQIKPLDDVDKVAELAVENGELMYFLRRDGDCDENDLNVIGGFAPGVKNDRWPMFGEEEPMEHLYTLDLATMPALRSRFSDYRTMSVFCFEPDNNQAWESGNGHTAVVFSTDDEVVDGWETPEDIASEHEARFEVVPVRVNMADAETRKRVYAAHARVGGDPIWLQSEEGWGNFVMQFDEAFVYMNLGDAGIMYVYDDGAFWQCH